MSNISAVEFLRNNIMLHIL